MNLRDSQSLLDFVLAFAAAIVLILGVARIWVWFNANFAKRQVSYQEGRLIAGKPNIYNPDVINRGGLDPGANQTCLNCTYQPLDLTEEWVFASRSSGQVSPTPGPAGNFSDNTPTEEDCANWTGPIRDAWSNERYQLNIAADNLDQEADDLSNTYNQPMLLCQWWFPFCTWESRPNERRYRKTKHEVMRNIRKMKYAAKELRDQANKREQDINGLTACCDISDPDSRQQSRRQWECIMNATNITQGCPEFRDAKLKELDNEISGAEYDRFQLDSVVRAAEATLINCRGDNDCCEDSGYPRAGVDWDRRCYGGNSCYFEDMQGHNKCSLQVLWRKLSDDLQNIDTELAMLMAAKNQINGCCEPVPYCDSQGWNSTQILSCRDSQVSCIGEAMGEINATINSITAGISVDQRNQIEICKNLPTREQQARCINNVLGH